MRKYLILTSIIFLGSLGLWAQAKSSGGSSHPTAVIDTTAGKLTCTLFPDKAPIGVANFIGLATGTKDWTSPITHQKKHGVPLYDGTIFHRVIPNFMIQGGDPMGTGTGDPGYAFKKRNFFRFEVRSSGTHGLCECRTGYERLAIFYYRDCLPELKRRVHHFRSMR